MCQRRATRSYSCIGSAAIALVIVPHILDVVCTGHLAVHGDIWIGLQGNVHGIVETFHVAHYAPL